MGSQWKGRALPTECRGSGGADGHSVKQSEIVFGLKGYRLGEVKSRTRLPGAGKDRSRDLPAFHQEVWAVAAEQGFERDLPHVVDIEGVANIVLRGSIGPAQIVRVLWIQDVTAKVEVVVSAVGDFIE